MKGIFVSLLIFLAVSANRRCCAATFPERSQPAPGGGLRNDNKEPSTSDSNRHFARLVAEGDRVYGRGDYAKSIDFYTEALQLPLNALQRARTLTNRGNARGMLEQNDAATKDFEEAIRVYSNLSAAYSGLARIYLKLERLNEAMYDVDRAIILAPKNPDAHDLRARLLNEQHRSAEALQEIEKAIKEYPQDTSYRAARAATEFRLGETNKALADADAIIRSDPKCSEAFGVRAYSHIRLGRYDAAEKDLQMETSTGSSRGQWQWNEIAWARATCPSAKVRNGREAVTLANRACELDHWRGHQFIDTLAAAYAETGDFSSAIKYEEQALTRVEDTPLESIEGMQRRLALYKKHQPYRDDMKL